MRSVVSVAIFIVFTFSVIQPSFCASRDLEDPEDDSTSSTSSALGSAVMGGLLGAGLGAAIGSASGKAGQGAAIGAGVGALGGTLLGAEKARKEKIASRQAEEDRTYYESEPEPTQKTQKIKVKKRVIREFDQEGNVISEKEVAE